jgi:hypothetical protein
MFHAVVITIVNNRAGHAAEYRLDDVEELCLSRQWQYLDSWRVIMGGPTVGAQVHAICCGFLGLAAQVRDTSRGAEAVGHLHVICRRFAEWSSTGQV